MLFLECSKCKTLIPRRGSNMHERNCGSKIVRPEKICQYCNQEFTNDPNYWNEKGNLKFDQHIDKCSQFGKFIKNLTTCSFCSKEFTSYSFVLAHVEKFCPENPDRIPQNSPASKVACSKCSLKFSAGNGIRT